MTTYQKKDITHGEVQDGERIQLWIEIAGVTVWRRAVSRMHLEAARTTQRRELQRIAEEEQPE